MTTVVCPQCQLPLPAGAPEGLCPKCLLGGAIGSGATPMTQPFAATPPGGFVPPSSAELAARFPQFEILELLGRGGMGAVYKARQPSLDRLVALKILPAEMAGDPSFADRFLREARALGKLNHPNIVAVHDFGQSGGLLFFVMEFVDGVNLRAALQEKRLPPREALAIVGQVCDALQYAHDEGIVHRDIKPENILLDKRGRVKIADFGLAKLVAGESRDHTLTGTHQVLGTMRYMAPEQLEGSRHVDHRADIYSLGVVFYEILTGEVPMGRFAPPSKKSDVDARVDDVVLRALEREPDERYQHASDVKGDVEKIASASFAQPVRPRSPDTSLHLPQRIAPRDVTDLVLIAVLALVILGIFFVAPFFATGFTAAALGVSGDEDIFPIALVGGLGVFLTAFAILGLGSVKGLSLDRRGLTLHRYAGPSKPLVWEDIARVEEMSRWDTLWQVGLWPGVPPRGSIIGMSTKHYFRIDSSQGSWYFCPNNPQEFERAVERHWDGQVSRITPRNQVVEEQDLPTKPVPFPPARSSSGWGWGIVAVMVVCFVVLPCCVVGLIGAAFTALVPVRSVRDRPNNDPISEVTEAVGDRSLPLRARQGDLDYVRDQLAWGADANAKDNEGKPLIINAALGGHTGVLKEVVKGGAMVDDRDMEDRTALMMAAWNGHLSSVDYLLSAGASLKTRDRSGKTVLDWAVTRNRTSIEELLLEKGVEKTPTYLTYRAHHLIAAGRSAEALKLLNEAETMQLTPASDWWYEVNHWQHRVPEPAPFLHALSLEAAQLSKNEEEGKRHAAALAAMKGLDRRTLYFAMWLSPEARMTNEPDGNNYTHEEFSVAPQSLAAIAADWRQPLKLQYRQEKVISSGPRREESTRSGSVQGIVRGLARESE